MIAANQGFYLVASGKFAATRPPSQVIRIVGARAIIDVHAFAKDLLAVLQRGIMVKVERVDGAAKFIGKQFKEKIEVAFDLAVHGGVLHGQIGEEFADTELAQRDVKLRCKRNRRAR